MNFDSTESARLAATIPVQPLPPPPPAWAVWLERGAIVALIVGGLLLAWVAVRLLLRHRAKLRSPLQRLGAVCLVVSLPVLLVSGFLVAMYHAGSVRGWLGYLLAAVTDDGVHGAGAAMSWAFLATCVGAAAFLAGPFLERLARWVVRG